MNICIIPSAELSYESGSTIYASSLINRLADKGHNVHVICSQKPEIRDKRVFYHCLDIMEHPVIDNYIVDSQRILDSIYRISDHLLKIHDRMPLDIVHAHYATINSMAAFLFNSISNVPYVVSCFGRDVFNGADNDIRYLNMIQKSIPAAKHIICSNFSVKYRIQKLIQNIDVPPISILRMPVDDKLFFLEEGNKNFLRKDYK